MVYADHQNRITAKPTYGLPSGMGLMVQMLHLLLVDPPPWVIGCKLCVTAFDMLDQYCMHVNTCQSDSYVPQRCRLKCVEKRHGVSHSSDSASV